MIEYLKGGDLKKYLSHHENQRLCEDEARTVI